MSFLEAFILGVVQGATEFLPISSSAHLILIPKFFGWSEQPLVFDTTLHIGTAIALLIFFWKDLFSIAKAFISNFLAHKFSFGSYDKDSRLGLYILLAIIPADIIGLIFHDLIEQTFRSMNFVLIFLLLGTGLMFLAQKFFNRQSSVELTYKKSIFVGLFQVLAFLPGFSRSGSTISGGMILGLTKEDAARFSFLMSVPITLEAALYQLITNGFVVKGVGYDVLVLGLISSLVTGLLCIKFLLNYLKTKSLDIFIYYRLVLIFAIILFFGFNG